MAKKRGVKGRIKFMLNESPVAKSVRGVGEYLGLYPDKPEPATTTKSLTTPLDTSKIRMANFQKTKDKLTGVTRPQHFDQGSTEHLPEGVVSLNAYRESKAAKKPEGY